MDKRWIIKISHTKIIFFNNAWSQLMGVGPSIGAWPTCQGHILKERWLPLTQEPATVSVSGQGEEWCTHLFSLLRVHEGSHPVISRAHWFAPVLPHLWLLKFSTFCFGMVPVPCGDRDVPFACHSSPKFLILQRSTAHSSILLPLSLHSDPVPKSWNGRNLYQ